MSYPYAMLVTAVTGNVLAATDYNNEHTNHINNNIPGSIGGDSANIAGMQATVDPYPSSVESLAADLKGELERLRYVIQDMKVQSSQWYVPVKLGRLLQYRKPVLQYSSGTVVNMETGLTGTSGQAAILFPDGNYRTDSTTTRINCNFAQNAVLSGTAQSGLRTGSQTANTWYAIYAVKVTDSSTNFVAVADTVLPLQANYATLNSNFGTNGWVYLGLVRNGNGLSANNTIIQFYQSGNFTAFLNSFTGTSTSVTLPGMLIANATGAGRARWTYAAGTSGAVLPNNITLVKATGSMSANAGTGNPFAVIDSTNSGVHAAQPISASWASAQSVILPPQNGIDSGNGGTSSNYDLAITGFWDGALGVGANPLL